MIGLIDIFDIYQEGKITELGALQSNTGQRLTKSAEELRLLEQRYEHLRLVTMAMWKLFKDRTGATESDLKQYVDEIDLLDGKMDGKLIRHRGVKDCSSCRRRILKTAMACPYCGVRNHTGDAFQGA